MAQDMEGLDLQIEELHEQIHATKLELLEMVSSHYTHFSDTFKVAKVKSPLGGGGRGEEEQRSKLNVTQWLHFYVGCHPDFG